jgi:hypothetical protein
MLPFIYNNDCLRYITTYICIIILTYKNNKHMTTTKKDNRKVYKNEKIEVNGTNVTFDGKYSPDSNTLKIYRMHGDVNLFAEAIQNFCIDNKIATTIY